MPHHLEEGEQVVNMSDGQYGNARGLVVVTDRRILFVSEGMARTTFEDFPYSKISSVHTSTGILMGEMTIHASGNKARITSLLKERAPEIGDYVRSRISDSDTGTPVNEAREPKQSPDPIDELRKYAQLRDEGIISEDDFQAKKQRILGD